jgi:hypothetical protein
MARSCLRYSPEREEHEKILGMEVGKQSRKIALASSDYRERKEEFCVPSGNRYGTCCKIRRSTTFW